MSHLYQSAACHKCDKKLSYRRETRATLCINWNIVLPLYDANRSPVSLRSTFSNCHVLFRLPTRGTRLIPQTPECADDVVYTHQSSEKKTKYTAACSTSKKHAWKNWHHVPLSPHNVCGMNDVATTLHLEVFTQRNFAADFFGQKLNLTGKTAKSRFVPPFGGNAPGSSMTRWKAHCRLPISDNYWMFC